MTFDPSISFLLPDGVWCQAITAPQRKSARPALFLDRDGVIVEEVPYLHRTEDVVLIPGAAAVIAAANNRGVPVVIVTNQAGIGRGYYGWREFSQVQDLISQELARGGARVDAVLACSYHPAKLMGSDKPDRKAPPRMLLRAATSLQLHLAQSWIVGDKTSDLEAGRAGGLAGG